MKLNDRNTTPFSFIKNRTKNDINSHSGRFICSAPGCARTFPVFAQWYSVTIYAGLKNTIARFSGLFPFSLSEAGLYLLLAFCLYWILHSLKRPLLLFKNAFFLASLLFFIYTINCGINYYRKPFSEEAGFSEELKKAVRLRSFIRSSEYLVKQVNETVPGEDSPKRNAFLFPF